VTGVWWMLCKYDWRNDRMSQTDAVKCRVQLAARSSKSVQKCTVSTSDPELDRGEARLEREKMKRETQERDYWSAKMRVACEPLPMRPITKHPPRTTLAVPPLPARLVACQSSSSSRPPFNLAGLVGRSQSEERETGTCGTSRTDYLTSPRDLPVEMFLFLLPSRSSAVVIHASPATTTTPLPHAPAHHHNLAPKRSNPPGRPTRAATK